MGQRGLIYCVIAVCLININLSNASVPVNPCTLPMALGRTCNFATFAQSMKRVFYFDSVQKCCSPFFYLGCGGNGNNFFSAGRCVKTCVGPPPGDDYYDFGDIDAPTRNARAKTDCLLKPDMGPCRALIQMWYYDMTAGTCDMFSYGGCQGNGNMFDSEDECLEFCKGAEHEIRTGNTEQRNRTDVRRGVCLYE